MVSPLLDRKTTITVPRARSFDGILMSLPTLRRDRALSFLCSLVLTPSLIDSPWTGISPTLALGHVASRSPDSRRAHISRRQGRPEVPIWCSRECSGGRPCLSQRLHISVLVGKQLIKLFYNKDYDKSYYLGCSRGGRQGINTADLFPDDCDGIVAGSPALYFNNVISRRARFFITTSSDSVNSSNFITPFIWIV